MPVKKTYKKALRLYGRVYSVIWPGGQKKDTIQLVVTLDKNQTVATNKFKISIPEKLYPALRTGSEFDILLVPKDQGELTKKSNGA